MSRVRPDIQHCLKFIAKHPYGRASERRRELFSGLDAIKDYPKARRVERKMRTSGVELRTRNVAQFVIIYSYFEPNAVFLNGMVSIRAIRHRRVRNPFHGVKERSATYRFS